MAQPPSAPLPDSVTFGNFSGLKNMVTRERLKPDELARAINVDIDDIGQVHRRRGYTRVSTGDFHSLFTDTDDVVYGVKNGTLGVINPDYSFRPLKSGINFQPGEGIKSMAYAQVGPQVYYSCATDSGIIDKPTMTVLPWGDDADLWLSPVVNPTAGLPAVRGKLLGKPPLATALAYWNGRIYMAQGRTVWATELYLYKFVDKTRTFIQFENDVTGIGAVSDGLYIGTTDNVWYLSGTFNELKRVNVMDSGMIPGSMTRIPAELANPSQIDAETDAPVKVSLAFMTTNGFCAAQEQGVCYNLTENKLFFPTMTQAAALYRRQDGVNQYIVVTDTGGTPSSSARIGDYIDAELIRGTARNDLGNVMNFGDHLDAEIVRA
jgi:hypothetical protein